MRKLGISVYPNRENMEQTLNYIRLAGQLGYGRIFTCLISAADQSLEELVRDFSQLTATAKEYDMEVIADIDPAVFKAFNATYQNLEAFHTLGLAGLRLDLGFSGIEESIMTCNPYGMKVEINMSQGTKAIDNILSHRPVKENLWGCHNFYPHVYTGLGVDHFLRSSKQFKDLGVRTAAFVNAESAEFGPWPVSEGLCTVELHRQWPIERQAKHLWASGLIDDVIIANAFASEEELRRLSRVNRYLLEFTVELEPTIPALERKIILEEFHFNRGDISEYMIRSTQSRVKYKGHAFPPFHTPAIQRGDVLIESSLYDRYAGELQIALQPMQNSGKTNVVGRVVPEEHFLFDYLEPWMKFSFVEK